MNDEVNRMHDTPCMSIERKDIGEMNDEMRFGEIESFLKKNGKVAGSCKIPHELYKSGGRCLIEKSYMIYVRKYGMKNKCQKSGMNAK